MKATLVVPSFGGGPNLERTIQSCRHICDETIIISTALFESDVVHFKSVADKVIELPWNFVFLHGFGSLHNQASNYAKNDWLLLLGVAETFAESYGPFGDILRNSGANIVFRCNHVNDPHSWKRVWNRSGGPMWTGIIHEEIAMGVDSGHLLFRMQDTEKTPDPDPFRTEVRRQIKNLAYHFLYAQLIKHPERLGATNAGWLEFVEGSKPAILKFCKDNSELLTACIEGDKDAFLRLVENQMNAGKPATGVNYEPQGKPQSEQQTFAGVNEGIGGYEHLIEKS